MSYQNPNDNQAPFNMAVATLMRLDEILKEYKKISILLEAGQDENGNIVNKEIFLAMKIKTAKQLFINAIPLIAKEDQKTECKNLLKDLNVPMRSIAVNDPNNPHKIPTPYYDSKIENLCDNFVMKVEEILQEEKYFMPPKNDPRFAFRRD